MKVLLKKFFYTFINKIIFKQNDVRVPKTLIVDGILRLKRAKKSNLCIGENVKINSSWRSNSTGGGQTRTLLQVAPNSKLFIGNRVGISNSTISVMKEVIIEDDVNIGVNCKIYDSDFHSITYKERMQQPDSNIKSSAVRIKKGAWVGGHVIILKGVTIGEKSVIGAGAVVTKSVPDNELWAGNPAKYIKKISNN